jgi:hypothetical protein
MPRRGRDAGNHKKIRRHAVWNAMRITLRMSCRGVMPQHGCRWYHVGMHASQGMPPEMPRQQRFKDKRIHAETANKDLGGS